jgi:integrase
MIETESPAKIATLDRGALRHVSDLEAVVVFLTGSPFDPAAFPWQQLRRDDLRVVRQWATDAFPPQTAFRLLSAVRAAVRLASKSADERGGESICRGRSRAAAGRRLASRDLRGLFDILAEDESPAARRDAAVLALLLLGSLRASDVASLAIGDYEDDTGALRIRRRAKRGIERVLIIEGECQSLLLDWLRERGRGSGPLFYAIDSRGALREAVGLGASAIGGIVTRRVRVAGISRLTPGDLRAAYIAELRRQSRQGAFTSPARFGYSPDDEPSLVLTTLSSAILPPQSEEAAAPW